jgi:prepilin-type N-terminal cleavage/methylation domain-containing protein
MTRVRFRHKTLATARDRAGGTGVAFTRHVLTVPTPARPARESGFTLIEVLVVLVIVGVLAALVTVPINSYWQRARTETTAGDIRNFLQQAFTEAINQHTPINVTLQQDAASHWVLQLNPPPPFPRDINGTYTLPEFVSLDLNPGAGAGGWPVLNTVRTLTCDTKGLTVCPSGATGKDANECDGIKAVKETKTLSITHTRMMDGTLTPKVRYDIQVFPLWNVTIRKTLV